MTLRIVHLSDLHLRDADQETLAIANAIGAAAGSGNHATSYLILVTGDIAFAGSEREYNAAKKFFAKITSEISERAPRATVSIRCVPGNHDCDFNLHTKTRNLHRLEVLNTEGSGLEPLDIETCTSVQTPYFAFASEIQCTPVPSSPTDKLFQEHILTIGEHEIAIHSYNTAWLSMRPEVRGETVFPLGIFDNNPDKQRFTVGLFHHPTGWFQTANGKRFLTHIESRCDIILTGHEHTEDEFDKIRKNKRARFFEAPAVFPHGEGERGFKLLELDFASSQLTVKHYGWNGSIFATKDQATRPEPLIIAKRSRYAHLQWTDSFANYLNELGFDFRHPNRKTDQLKLDEIFVLPQLRLTASNEKRKTQIETIIEGDEVLKLLRNTKELLISGDEKSGKTSLAKKACLELREHDQIPVLISSEDIVRAPTTAHGLDNVIARKLEQQYGDQGAEEIIQLPISARTVILEDFDQSAPTSKKRAEILDHLRSRFGQIIVTASDLFQIQDLLSGEQSSGTLKFSKYEILPFGHVLRDQLIQKWLLLGSTLSDEEHAHKRNQFRVQLNTILGNRLIPSYPFLILILIQQIESQSNHKLESGSFGYFYEYLITQSLSALPQRLFDVSTCYTYLTELAYRMFENESVRLSESEFDKFHQDHCKTFRIELPKADLLIAMDEAAMLRSASDFVEFRYSYIKLYFTANALAERISEPDTQRRIKEMCENIHHEQSAQLLVFLSYLVKSDFVLNEILSRAKSLLAEYEPSDFDKKMGFLTKISNSLPPMIFELGTRTPEENQQSHLRSLDKLERSSEQTQSADEKQEINQGIRINAAFKTIQVLGQILRNFAGSLEGDRKELIARECYQLGMRTFGFLVSSVETDIDKFVAYIKANIEHQHPKGRPGDLSEKAKELSYIVIQLIAFSFIKRISESLGSTKLKLTYSDVAEKNTDPATALIDLSIKLDHFGSFPEQQVDRLHQTFEKKFFASGLLKRLVLHYFRLFPSQERLKQSVCSKLKISLTQVRAVDNLGRSSRS